MRLWESVKCALDSLPRHDAVPSGVLGVKSCNI